MKFQIFDSEKYKAYVYYIYLKDKYRPVFYDFEDMVPYTFKTAQSYHHRYAVYGRKECQFDCLLRVNEEYVFHKYFYYAHYDNYNSNIYQNIDKSLAYVPVYCNDAAGNFRQNNNYLTSDLISKRNLFKLYLNLVAKYKINYTPQEFLDNIIILNCPHPYAKSWVPEANFVNPLEHEYDEAVSYEVLEYKPSENTPEYDKTYDVAEFAKNYAHPELAFIRIYKVYNTLAYLETFDVINDDDVPTLIDFIHRTLFNIKTVNGVPNEHLYSLSVIVTKFKPEVRDAQCISARVRVAIRAFDTETIDGLFRELRCQKSLRKLRNED